MLIIYYNSQEHRSDDTSHINAVSFSFERNPNFTYSIIFFVCSFVPPGRRQPLNWSRNGEVDQGRFRIDEEEEEDNDDYEY